MKGQGDSIVDDIEKDRSKSSSAKDHAEEDGAEGAQDQGQEGPDGASEAQPQEIVTRMNLTDLALSGMSVVESSAEYKALFGEGDDCKGALSSVDLKLLELRLELFLWDWVLGQGLTCCEMWTV